MPSLTDLSVSSSASSVLTLLGWQDKRSQANEAERALADALEAAYEQYQALPDQSSAENLSTRLNAVIDKLEKDRATAARLAKEASDRLNQETADYSRSGITDFIISGLTARLKTFTGSDDAALVERYNQLAAKYSAQLEELAQLRDSLQPSAAELVEVTEHSSSHRRLLQTTSFGLPATTADQFCFPTGACELSVLSDGRSGFVLQGEAADDVSGISVNTAGDINGDGLPDIQVGAPNALSNTGKTYVVFGSNSSVWGNGLFNLSALMDGQRGFMLQGMPGDNSGRAVSPAGDLNGDGISDILVGAPGTLASVGKVYVIFGSTNSSTWRNGVLNLSTLMDGQHGCILQGEAVGDNTGRSVSSAGDVNGDGIPDFMVGANQAAPSGKLSAGKTYVIFGSHNSSAWGSGILNLSNLMDGQRGFVLQGEAAGDLSSHSIRAGDVNGDGVSDILVGAYNAAVSGNVGAGKTYIIFGSKNSSAWGNGTLDLVSRRVESLRPTPPQNRTCGSPAYGSR